MKKKYNLKTGFFNNGVPFTRIGKGSKVLIDIEGLSFKNEPASGFELKDFIKTVDIFTEDYTIYHIGRKPNSPPYYSFENMVDDYAITLRQEFKEPVDIMGISTGGHLAQFLAANHPEIVKKLVIISAAFRTSKIGLEIEARAAEYFKQEKYAKTIETIFELIINSKLMKGISKLFIKIFTKKIFGDVKYPNDFLNEIRADKEMNSKERLNDIISPTLILCGDLDLCYSIEDVRDTAEGIPNAKLIIYEGIGHNLIRKKRNEVKKDILNFLKQS